MNKPKHIFDFVELLNKDGKELFLLSLNGFTHTMSLDTIRSYCTDGVSIIGGTYDPNSGEIILTNSSGGTFSITGIPKPSDDIHVTGFTYIDNNLAIQQTNGQSDLLVNINSMTGLTINGDLHINGISSGNSVSNLSIDSNGKLISGSTANISSLSDLGFEITALPTAVIRKDVSLPNDSYVTYHSPLVVDNGVLISVPSSSEFNIVDGELGVDNISNAIYTVNKGLNAENTTNATTSVMIYGVNVFTGVTATDFATKLPQPVTGKSVKVINNGSTLLHIFPSNVGGRVNNLPIDTPAVIPPDGNLYEFICIENPLPGEWTFSAPATGQYDSGEISISISALTIDGVYNPIVSAYDSTRVYTTNQFSSVNWGYNGKNKSNLIITNYGSGKYTVAFRPDISWKGISKIKVYTNLLTDSAKNTQVRLLAGGESSYYSPFDNTMLNSAIIGDNNELFTFNLNNKIAGSASTGATIYSSANIGDNGTVWADKVAYSDQYNSDVNLGGDGGTFIGNKSLGAASYPYGQTWDNTGNEINTGDIVDKYYSSFISFQIRPFSEDFNYGVIPDFKFRFIIEYYQ
jgi:hypothetical protein